MRVYVCVMIDKDDVYRSTLSPPSFLFPTQASSKVMRRGFFYWTNETNIKYHTSLLHTFLVKSYPVLDFIDTVLFREDRYIFICFIYRTDWNFPLLFAAFLGGDTSKVKCYCTINYLHRIQNVNLAQKRRRRIRLRCETDIFYIHYKTSQSTDSSTLRLFLYFI